MEIESREGDEETNHKSKPTKDTGKKRNEIINLIPNLIIITTIVIIK